LSKFINLNEKRKKKEKKKLIMNIAFVAVAIYIIYVIYLTIRIPNDTVTIESGTLTAEESAIGYVIREETVVQGENYKNGIYQIVSEGERAAKKQTIFRYYGQNEEELKQKIEEINEKIQNALEKEKALFPTDIKNLEEEIDKKIENLRLISDVQELADNKKQIADIIFKKATIAGENSKSGSYIKKLVSEREKYEKKLVQGSEYVVAPESGVVSYRVDGLEDLLKPEGFEEITIDKLEQLDVKTGKIVSTSNESAKVINNFNGYIATIVSSKAAKEAEVGKNVLITLASGKEIKATINYIKDQDNDKKIIIFKLNELFDELISYRKLSINITWWSAAGLKVPNDAILEDENNVNYVLKKTTTGTKKCFIEVLKTNEKYSIIRPYSVEKLKELGIDISKYDGLEVYDNIMLYPKK